MFLFRSGLAPIVIFNQAVSWILTLLFVYQFVYMLLSLIKGLVRLPAAKQKHRYAFVIAAHNEESVIANLVRSIKGQNYPAELLDIYVVADSCTDATASIAQRAGAIVYERNDLARRGKSWVLDYAFNRILEEKPGVYEGFFVFDADNVLDPDYVNEMNKAFDQGFLAVMGYRNSKNFDSSWISSSYAIHFLREAKYLNNPRMILGSCCTVSGSGWLISERIVRAMQGWDFHALTEDLQFSAFCAANRIRIGFAPAEFYDEQPTTFAASWTQRLRWSKGFYQVLFSYVRELFAEMLHGSLSAYDMLATLGPASVLTVVAVFANGLYLLIGWFSHGFLATDAELAMCRDSLVSSVFAMYALFFVMGFITLVTEREHIHCSNFRKLIVAVLTYPIFMISYIPINVVALFRKVEWVPTKHTLAMDFDDILESGLDSELVSEAAHVGETD